MTSYTLTTPRHERFRIVDTTSQEEWLDARRGYVTASEIARLAHLRTADWDELRALKAAAGPARFTGNRYTVWGHEREPIIVEELAATVDVTLRHNERLCVSLEWPEYAATPDAISFDGRVTAQIKTTSKPLDPQHPGAEHYDQIQWELMVTGADRCIYAVEEHANFQPLPLRWAVVEPDAERQEELRDIARRFLDGGPAIPEEADEVAAAIDAWAAAEDALATAKADAVEARARFEELTAGRAESVFGNARYTVTRTAATTTTTLDQRQLKAEHPDIWAKYQVTKPRPGLLRKPAPRKAAA